MCNNETQQMLMTIIEHAKTAKPSEFRFIRTWKDYKFCKGKVSSFKLLVTGLNKTSERLFKRYYKGVLNCDSNFNQLLAYQQLQQVIRFYEQELTTYLSMVYEYEAYLMEGHYFQSFLGEIRADSDLHDFRE